MIGNPKLASWTMALDSSMAVSFGLTSYVSGIGMPVRIVTCSRPSEPRRALNQLILGWERNDRPWFEASLGPHARASFQLLLQGKTWARMREELWRGKSDDNVAVGYRFKDAGRWSDPEEPLDEKRLQEDFPTNYES
jgi:hypothetical protein